MEKLIRFISFIFLMIVVETGYSSSPPSHSDDALLESYGIKLDILKKIFKLGGYNGDDRLASMNDFAQKNFLRKPGTERWDIPTDAPEKTSDLMNALKELGLRDERAPTHPHYTHVIILGATLPSMAKRIDFLMEKLTPANITQVVFLVGERPLDSKGDHYDGFTKDMMDKLSTEADGSQALWTYKTSLEKGKVWSHVAVHYVKSPMKKDGEKAVRPNTADTIRDWLKTKPVPGKVVAISSQPHVLYQHATLREFLKTSDGWVVETVGPQTKETKVGTYLDALARTLYTIHQHHLSSIGPQKICYP